jgi:DNA-binding MarR family transcriptional regulator
MTYIGGSRVFQLTDLGRAAHHRLRAAIVAGLDKLMSPLSDRERDPLQELLSRVIKAAEMRQ